MWAASFGYSFDHPAGHRRPDQRFPFCNTPDRRPQIAQPDVFQQETASAGPDTFEQRRVVVEGRQ